MKTLYLCFLLACVPVHAATDVVAHDDWEQLNRQVEARRIELAGLIKEAKQKGIVTDYASVSEQVIQVFQGAARHDRSNVDRVRRIFQTFSYYAKTDPTEADQLPFKELQACLEVADHALAELRQQLNGTVTLTGSPDFSKGSMALGAGYYRLEGNIVFPSSLVWMPKEERFMQAFGRLGEAYYQLGHLQESGTVNGGVFQRAMDSLESQCQRNAAPLVYFMGHAAAGWMKQDHPEILQGARHFTQYDIDSPLIRTWIEQLCAGVLPGLSEIGSTRPQMHLLANEPHFSTMKGGWRANNGLSAFSLQKYRQWLTAKYRTVDAVNEAYGTTYASLDRVTVDLPIDPALRGGAFWYDWCRFNMDRVNNWFTFLKRQVRANDRHASPVTIKMLGFTLSTLQRDHGLDIEYLTKLQDIPGADLRVAPHDAIFYGKQEVGLDPETDWRSRYAYDWVEQSMYLDFTKSLCPDKLFYDSEWHGFGAVSWRHFKMKRSYVRSALWLAFTHGMGAIKPWLWGRDSDGALRDSADHIGELATQPIAVDAYGRVIKELNAHAERVVAAVPKLRPFVIYYCEEAAIQDEQYTSGFKDIYEALKLLNLPVGFTTPSEIGGLDAKKQILVVSPTRFIADNSLTKIKVFQRSGGRVVLFDAEQCFLKDEMGLPRSNDGIKDPFVTLPLKGVTQMTARLDAALNLAKSAMPMEIVITDLHGKKAYGVMISQIKDPKTGKPILLLNNVSKGRRVVILKPNGKSISRIVDVLTRQSVQTKLTLEPCDVRMLMNTD
jgi:beta-galactosidase